MPLDQNWNNENVEEVLDSSEGASVSSHKCNQMQSQLNFHGASGDGCSLESQRIQSHAAT